MTATQERAAELCSAMGFINCDLGRGLADYFDVLEALELPRDEYLMPRFPITKLAWRAYDAANRELVESGDTRSYMPTTWQLAEALIRTGEIS